MGTQVIRQPDNRLAVFDSTTGTIVMWDAKPKSVEKFFVDLAAERARRDAQRVIADVTAGRARHQYFQFTKTWADALASDREHSGRAWKKFGPPAGKEPR